MNASIAFGIFGSAVMCVWSTVMFAWVNERQRRASYRDLIARAAIRRRHDRELAEIRYYLQAADKVIRPISAPVTQPIVMPAPEAAPAPEGPATEPADAVFVIAQAVGQRTPVEQARAEKNAAWVESELSRFQFTGRKR